MHALIYLSIEIDKKVEIITNTCTLYSADPTSAKYIWFGIVYAVFPVDVFCETF